MTYTTFYFNILINKFFLKREYSLLSPALQYSISQHLKFRLDAPCLPSLSSFVFHHLSDYLTFSLSVSLYLFWSVSVSKVIASCMDPDSAMVTAGIKPSVKIIMAPCWWGSQCYFHSGGIPGVLPLPWKCLIITTSQSVIAFSSMVYFPEAPWFVIVDWALYACGEWTYSSPMSEWVYKQDRLMCSYWTGS